MNPDTNPLMPAPEPKTPLERAQHAARLVWGRLLTGIVVAIPIIVTIWVLKFGYDFITNALAPLWALLNIQMTPILGFAATLLLLIGIGFMATHVLGRQIIDATERLLLRVPVIAPVYNAVKQTMESLRTLRGSSQFNRVVYVEYPGDGGKLVGFATGHLFEPKLQQEFTMVFLPMAPNPLTGFVVAVPSSRVTECSLTFEEASKLVVSAGLVVPQRLASAEPPMPS